jgi:hypothetical protein
MFYWYNFYAVRGLPYGTAQVSIKYKLYSIDMKIYFVAYHIFTVFWQSLYLYDYRLYFAWRGVVLCIAHQGIHINRTEEQQARFIARRAFIILNS